MRIQFGVWAILVASLIPHALSAREWTDSSGKFHVEAELVSFKNGKVYLELSDGKVVSLSLDQLSREDIKHLASLPEHQEYFAEHPQEGVEKKSASSKTKEALPVKLSVSDTEPKVGEVRRFGDLGWGVESLAFSPDGRFVALGKMDRAIMLYDVEKSQRVAFFDALEGLGQVTALAFTPDGSKLLSGGYTGRIQVWDVAPNGLLTEAQRFVGHTHPVHTITVSKDGARVLSAGDGKIARCWSLDDAREQFAIDGFSRSVKETYITRGGKQALACDGATLVLIDMHKGEAIEKMVLEKGSPQTIAVAPDGSLVVIQDGYTLAAWEIRSGKGLPLFQDREIQWSALFLPNSKYLLSGGQGKVNLWDVAKHRKIYEFDTAGSYYVKAIACSPDNRHFAAIPASAGQALQIFRLPAEVAD